MYPTTYNDVNKIVTEKYLNFDNGFYIEVGGADGYTQSNTWHLENYKNWTGILVEPDPDAAEKCRNNRPKSDVFNYALVGNDYPHNEIKLMRRIIYSGDPGLMSSIEDSPIRQNTEWMKPATDNDVTKEIIVQTTTLNGILDSMNVTNIDFFSLDVEGYEIEVLKGLNMKKYCPKVMLIEWHSDITDIKNFIADTHDYVEQLSKHDYLFLMRE